MKKCLSILLVITLSLAPVCFAGAESFSENPDLIEQAALSVLKLSTFDTAGDPIAAGSGFVMFDNRTLITNYHVMEDAYTMTAESDEGYQYYITGIKAVDKQKDIAIMQFSAPTVMTPLVYSLDGIKRGERVTAIGSPVGLKNTVSMGNISYVFKEADVNWIQTTAPISHGSSGGALFNEDGKVIGVTSATRSDGQNINFAVNIVEAVDLYHKWDHTVIKLGQQPGFTDMLCDKGDKYYWGKKEEQNFNLAVKYYEKAVELGHIRATYMLGRCYNKGNGVQKDKNKALDYIMKASNLGNPDAIGFLGHCYVDGEGVLKNEREGLDLLFKAVELGNTEAMGYLALYYDTKGEYDQYFYWAQKGALSGDRWCMRLLGISYEDGEGIDVEEKKAFEWYSKAADADDEISVYLVARCYLLGIGVTENKDKMIDILYGAAERDNNFALYYLACCYKDGEGVRQDSAKAFEYALKAAELGNTGAMIIVGQCFENGIMNLYRAEEWYQKAADEGNENAQQYLDNLHSGVRNTW